MRICTLICLLGFTLSGSAGYVEYKTVSLSIDSRGTTEVIKQGVESIKPAKSTKLFDFIFSLINF